MTVSWLDLERYRLGELEPDRERSVEAALAADPALRARLACIEQDERPLPPLPAGWQTGEGLPTDSGASLPDPPGRGGVIVLLGWRKLTGGLVGGGALLAAALALFVARLPNTVSAPLPSAATTWKGGELALQLDRERDGRVQVGATGFRDGDRFGVRLTCPPGERAWDLVAYQDGAAFFPLDNGATVRCGNLVALPGALAPTGDEVVTVCVVVGDGLDRATLAEGFTGLAGADGVVCQELLPED